MAQLRFSVHISNSMIVNMSTENSSHHHQAFRWSILLNAGLSGLQIVIGISFGSIALIGDAVHNIGDVIGLMLGWGAETLGHQPSTRRFSYGFGRSTQIAAVANGVLILMASAVVCVESLQRFVDPIPVVTGPIAWAAIAGLVVNLLSARLFESDHDHDLNRRAALLHLIGDAAVSAAVLLSTILVSVTGWIWLDPLTGLLVGAVVGWMGFDLLRKGMAEILDATPTHIDLNTVQGCLENLPGVDSVHHLHVWALSTSRVALTAHLVRDIEAACSDQNLLRRACEAMESLRIHHCTFQIEGSGTDCSDELTAADEPLQ